jgi:hypothetical protein
MDGFLWFVGKLRQLSIRPHVATSYCLPLIDVIFRVSGMRLGVDFVLLEVLRERI